MEARNTPDSVESQWYNPDNTRAQTDDTTNMTDRVLKQTATPPDHLARDLIASAHKLVKA
eukprot:735851-Prymnesium_polylepis.1